MKKKRQNISNLMTYMMKERETYAKGYGAPYMKMDFSAPLGNLQVAT